jgi:hypothetical protein
MQSVADRGIGERVEFVRGAMRYTGVIVSKWRMQGLEGYVIRTKDGLVDVNACNVVANPIGGAA